MILNKKSLLMTAFLLIAVLGFSLALFITKNPPQGQANKDLTLSTPSVIAEKITASTSAKPLQSTELVMVTRVIDGDTIEIEGGQKVRYIGIDTPEAVDPREPVGCFGLESSQKNKELVEGKTVRLERDVSETDKYGRLLRYIYLPSQNSQPNEIFVNEYLVGQGFAYASTYPPDVKYQDSFQQAQNEAQAQNRGLWASCPNNSYSPQATGKIDAQNPDCLIKGNISSSGEKIYHMPGQRYYDKTVIDEPKGERWFCTEEEAQQAGWRKSKI